MRLAELRIKIKSLAAEAKIIRKDERKYLASWRRTRDSRHRNTYLSLYSHRIGIVRREARTAQLALACLRGVPYKSLEAKCSVAPNWAGIEATCVRFGASDSAATFAAWRSAA